MSLPWTWASRPVSVSPVFSCHQYSVTHLHYFIICNNTILSLNKYEWIKCQPVDILLGLFIQKCVIFYQIFASFKKCVLNIGVQVFNEEKLYTSTKIRQPEPKKYLQLHLQVMYIVLIKMCQLECIFLVAICLSSILSCSTLSYSSS